jgi:hypothetical protein
VETSSTLVVSIPKGLETHDRIRVDDTCAILCLPFILSFYP